MKKIVSLAIFYFLLFSNVYAVSSTSIADIKVVSPIEYWLRKLFKFLFVVYPSPVSPGQQITVSNGFEWVCGSPSCSVGATSVRFECTFYDPSNVPTDVSYKDLTNINCDMSFWAGCTWIVPSNAKTGTWTVRERLTRSDNPFCIIWETSESFTVQTATTTTTTTTTTTMPKRCSDYGYTDSCPSGYTCNIISPVPGLNCCYCVYNQNPTTTTTVPKTCADYGMVESCPQNSICKSYYSPQPGLTCCSYCEPIVTTTTTIPQYVTTTTFPTTTTTTIPQNQNWYPIGSETDCIILGSVVILIVFLIPLFLARGRKK
jgi:hypothetical protein